MTHSQISKIKNFLTYFLTFLIPYQLFFSVYSEKHLTVALVLSSVLFFLYIKDIKFLLDDISVKIFILFLLTIGLRGLFSLNKLETVKYILFLGSGLVYYFVYLHSDIKKENIILTLVLATLPMVLLMVYTYHNEDKEFVILKYPVMKLFIEPDTLQNALSGICYPNIYESNRVGGFFMNLNTCSLFLGMLFTLVAGVFIYSENIFMKILFMIIMIFFLIGIIYTGSVGALIAFIFSICISGTFFILKKAKNTFRKFLYLLLFFVSIFFVNVILLKLNPRILNMQENQDFHGRKLIWQASLEAIKRNWLFGTGLSGKEWDKVYNPFARGIGAQENTPPHNMFLYIWGRSGIIPVVLLAMFFIIKFYTSFKNFYLCNNIYSLIVFTATMWFLVQSTVENFPLMDLRITAIYWLILALEKKNDLT